jgi:hypothetical protein
LLPGPGKSKKLTKEEKIQAKLDSLPTFRPYFMWLVMLIQVHVSVLLCCSC